MTQEERVLRFWKTRKGITQLQANQYLGVSRLAAVIFDLRQKGYNIESEMVEVTNRWGEKTRVARYYLKDTKQSKKQIL